MEKSFFVNLYSNHSQIFHAENTAANFTNLLPKRLKFEEEYEVALTNLHIPATLQNSFHSNLKAWLKIGITISLRCDIPNNYYHNIVNILVELNEKFKDYYQFIIQDNRVVARPTAENISVKLSPSLALVLGFVDWNVFTKDAIVGLLEPDTMRSLPSEVYVHSNISKPQIDGERYKNILSSSCINTKEYLYGSKIQVKISPLQYVALSVSEFDRIEIHLTDHKDRFLPFSSGTSYCSLHFKRCS